ncbi:MAG: class I SAM-dependent methyltransferase [Buchananella hordeovulneris]|nr:class I SAM-dependent methyltransferase [Buchananella hordeovulneris]
MTTPVLDVTCGARMMWFDKRDPRATFCDSRAETMQLCDGRTLNIAPDQIADFRNLPFDDESFYLVVFDPPHLARLGESSWLASKYGALLPTWQDDIRAGFDECFRVLKPHGVLVFKWSEVQIPLSAVLALSSVRPLFGHTTTATGTTHWCTFIKPACPAPHNSAPSATASSPNKPPPRSRSWLNAPTNSRPQDGSQHERFAHR